MTTRVLVCGGRDYEDWLYFKHQMFETIEPLSKYGASFMDIIIIQGGAIGADFMAKMWAQEHNCPWKETEFKANWIKYKKRAGPIRNQQMLDEGEPDLVVAFPGGKGTADMVSRARKAGIKIIEVE